MIRIGFRPAVTGISAVGTGALLFMYLGSLTATPSHGVFEEVRAAALPFDFNVARTYPWAAGQGTPTNTSGAATLSTIGAIGDHTAGAVAGTLNTVNQAGPLYFDLDSIRAISGSQATAVGEHTTVNVTDGDQWATGLAGVASSVGVLGVTTNAAIGDPQLADYAGVLQTANQLGPMFFDLNVLKAVSFTQAPPGALLIDGSTDQISAVDIGRWSAGIPGVITNSGTTGFVAYQNYGVGPVTEHLVGGLHTTTQIGSMTFDFNFLPAISMSTSGPGITVSLAPDMTAANTPFAASSPPAPGVVEPLVTHPTPAADHESLLAGAPTTNDTDTVAKTQTDNARATASPAVIPGVNGAPLSKTPKTATSGPSGSTQLDPFKSISDMMTNGFNAVTGTKPTATGTPPAGGTTTGSAAGGAGTGSGSGSGNDNG